MEIAGLLRGMGSVLNPQVAQEVNQQDLQKRELQMRLPQALMQMEALKNEQGFRQEASAAQGDPVKLAGAAVKYGKPELAANLYNQQEQRAARLQTAQVEAQRRQSELELRMADKALDRESKERLAAQADETKRMLAGLQVELGRSNQQLKQMQFQATADKKLQADTQRLQGALEKANLPQADTVLADVESIINNKPDSLEYVSGPKSVLPDWMAGKDATDARQAFAKLFNITLKDRSGAAVTNQELERLKKEFGSGAFKTSEQIKNAVEKARGIINNHYASVAAGFGPEALKGYNENIRQFGGKVVIDPDKAGKVEDPLGIR